VSTIVSDAVMKTSDAVEHNPKKADKKDKKLARSVGAALTSLEPEKSDDDDEEDVDVSEPLKAALDTLAEDQARLSAPGGTGSLSDEAIKRKRLFEGLTFFFSREIPRGYLELVVLVSRISERFQCDLKKAASHSASLCLLVTAVVWWKSWLGRYRKPHFCQRFLYHPSYRRPSEVT
jgi:hypothetical protein